MVVLYLPTWLFYEIYLHTSTIKPSQNILIACNKIVPYLDIILFYKYLPSFILAELQLNSLQRDNAHSAEIKDNSSTINCVLWSPR